MKQTVIGSNLCGFFWTSILGACLTGFFSCYICQTPIVSVIETSALSAFCTFSSALWSLCIHANFCISSSRKKMICWGYQRYRLYFVSRCSVKLREATFVDGWVNMSPDESGHGPPEGEIRHDPRENILHKLVRLHPGIWIILLSIVCGRKSLPNTVSKKRIDAVSISHAGTLLPRSSTSIRFSSTLF